MEKLTAEDVFDVVKNAQDFGLLGELPLMQGGYKPGDRYFESIQADLMENVDFEKLDQTLNLLAPTIHYMADPKHWEPEEFTAEEMFQAVKNLQEMGVFEFYEHKPALPGGGDRFFEYYQDILIHRIGAEKMDRILYQMGQCIRFLASDAALVNVSYERTTGAGA